MFIARVYKIELMTRIKSKSSNVEDKTYYQFVNI